MNDILLNVRDLQVRFGQSVAVNNISFELARGNTCAIVGESGSGKSLTALSIMGLLPPSAIVEGQVEFEGQQLLSATPTQLRRVRGSGISIVFQEPMTSLNPVFTIGEQIQETLHAHQSISKKSAKQKTIEAMKEVGIDRSRFVAYPHELSGGMRQRIMIASALISEPTLLIADEPTTALDATTSQQIIKLLKSIQERRELSLLFISHDLNLVSETSRDVLVMFCGNIIERGKTEEILSSPQHAYTKALLACKPSLHKKLRRLPTIQATL